MFDPIGVKEEITLFSLIVKGIAWTDGQDRFPASRIFEYTDPQLEARFKPNGVIDFAALSQLPTVFVEETSGRGDQIARIGRLVGGHTVNREVMLEYIYDPSIPPITDLVIAKHIFQEVQKLIENNPLLHKPSSFYDHLSRTYASHVVIGLRRQIKCDKQSISMARLFEEMIESPHALTRSYYVGLYKGSIVESFADRDFNKFAAPTAAHIDPKLVEADLARLRDVSRRCEEFADKRVAHRDKRDPTELPTYNEVDACIELLDQLYSRYFLLFHASNMESLLPTWQYDWKAVFRVPWIPPSE